MNKYVKLLDQWNFFKKKIEEKKNTKTFKEREFLRPVLVYKKFLRILFLAIPLTTKKKEGRFYSNFLFKEKESIVLLSQMRLLDAKRIKYSIGTLSPVQYAKVKKDLLILLN